MTEALAPEQRAALEVIAPVVDASTYLAGGVAVALRLGHRSSRDLDLFTPSDHLLASPDALVDAGEVVRVTGRGPGTLHLEIGGVPASLLRYRYPLLAPAERIARVAVPVASVDDLVCMKLSAVSSRGAARDFWDLHAMLTSTGGSLRAALDAYARKYASEDVGHVVRSLAYFGDAEAEPWPDGLSRPLWTTIQRDLREWVRVL